MGVAQDLSCRDVKTCTKCGVEKPLEAFCRYYMSKDGRQTWCKACSSEHRKRTKEQRRTYAKTYNQANKERLAEVLRQWRSENPERAKEQSSRYRAGKRRAAVEPVDFAAILNRDGFTCHICLGQVDPSDLHFDHVVPLSRGGAHSMENVKVAHSTCNLSKGTRLMSELSAVA